MTRVFQAVFFLAMLGPGSSLAAAEGPAASIDWSTAADVEVVEILTTNADGSVKETKIWLVVIDGGGYIRTSGSSWFENIQRDSNVTLRVGEAEYPLRAELVEDEALRERIQAALKEKYGAFSNFIPSLVGSNLMQLVARP